LPKKPGSCSGQKHVAIQIERENQGIRLFFFSELESRPSTLPDARYAARSGFMQCVAPVNSFPDRLRLRSEQAGGVLNYLKKEEQLLFATCS